MLSQHDDDEILHSMIFYNKSLNFVKINYYIYDKKLLIIIRCFKHWRFELAHTKFLIQIFIDHQTLKIFMKNKQLICRQVKYLNILFDFNFKIIFRTDKTNIKTDALIRMFDFHFENNDERIRQQHQIILILNKMQILINSINENDFTFDRIVQANKRNEFCQKFCKILIANVIVHDDIKFRNCRNVDDVLYMKNRLWISESQQVKLFQKIHDQSANDHSDKNRIIELIKWFYYWFRLKNIVEKYIRNCDFC